VADDGTAEKPGFWWGPGGGREVLALGVPLILSHGSFALQTFVDRLFLAWYSAEALAGAVAANFSTWAVISLFLGTAEYLTTFVAQYLGAGRPGRIGAALWQGVYFSLGAGLLIAALSPLAGPFFAAAGHAPGVMATEVAYSTVLLHGGWAILLFATLSTFFSGRGETRMVLFANLVATAVNIGLDYCWIFGNLGFPRWGAAGAARATIVSQVAGALFLLVPILSRRNRGRHNTLTAWRFDRDLFGRLLRFGLPSGVTYSLEVSAFALFLLMIGRLGTTPLAASSLAFALNLIVFIPMLGLGVAVSSLVGRHLGAGDPRHAERAAWSAFRISLVYMAACGVLYVFAPGLLLAPYASGADPIEFAGIAQTATVLLRFVALYSIFDMMNVIFAAGLKGAGDTQYPLRCTVGLACTVLLPPTYLLCFVFQLGVYAAWACATAYVVLLGLLMIARFRKGGWKVLRVIENA